MSREKHLREKMRQSVVKSGKQEDKAKEVVESVVDCDR